MEYAGGQAAVSRILVIDDDPDIATLISLVLKPQGYVVYEAHDGKDGLKCAYDLHPDLIILDVMMPEINGWDVCTRLRELSDVPILMLTARSAESDLLHGFIAGADDYVKKPFSRAELMARIQALLRRKSRQSGNSAINQYTDKSLMIDLETQVVKLNGAVINLSATEFSLLACLVRNMGKTMTHNQILREVWGHDYGNLSSKLTLYIFYLRKKLKNPRLSHDYIHTQWGRGYRFVPVNEFQNQI